MQTIHPNGTLTEGYRMWLRLIFCEIIGEAEGSAVHLIAHRQTWRRKSFIE